MADALYPATLPGPSSWVQQAPERRALHTLREPTSQARTRWRDGGRQAQAEWIYNAAEMATWKAWHEGPLATQGARLRWFSAVLPGRGGDIARTARYMAPPQRTALGNGLWRVSAPLYVRGAGVVPQQDATTAGGTTGTELREDGGIELREDGGNELRG